MISLLCRVTLLSDAGFPERAASLAGGRSLPYVPGSALLGVAAHAHYASGPDSARTLEAFHHGGVRFGDAYPVIPDSEWDAAGPAPLALHAPKVWARGVERRLVNRAQIPIISADSTQEKPLETGGLVAFDEAQGSVSPVSVRRAYFLRTAMGREGRGLDHHLYGLEALSSGQSFVARIDADDDELLQLARDALGAGARLGKSRGAEFGEAQFAFRECPQATSKTAVSAGDAVLLYCVSNLEVRDGHTGQPSLVPSADDLGLGTWLGDRIDERTFVRTRRASFIRHGGWDPERQFIVAGSVLAFRAKSDDGRGLHAAVEAALGGNRAVGWGRVLVNPPILARGELVWNPPGRRTDPDWRVPPAFPSQHVPAVIASRLQARSIDREREILQGELEDALALCGTKLTASQWRELARQASEATSAAGFVTELEAYATSGVRRRFWDQSPSQPLLASTTGPIWKQLADWVRVKAKTTALDALVCGALAGASGTMAENAAAASVAPARTDMGGLR